MRYAIRVSISLVVGVFLAVLAACTGDARPSEAEIRACVAAAPSITGTYGQLGGVMEFGKTITSQGGLGEPPKGTSIFPVRFQTADKFVWTFWAWKDEFGKLTCDRH